MTWQPVERVFPGGTDPARKLYGKAIRVCIPMSDVPTFVQGKLAGPKISLRVGQQGFVGYPPEEKLDHITLAFPQSSAPIPTIERMMRLPFHAVHVNWPTFKAHFEINI